MKNLNYFSLRTSFASDANFIQVVPLRRRMFWKIAFICGCLLFPNFLQAGEPLALELSSVVEVTGNGVFLQQLVSSSQTVPALRLCDSPEVGKTLELSRAQINDLLAAAAPG